MNIEDMVYEIERFIDQYEGTAIGESIRNKLDNTAKTDADRIEEIYNEIF